MERMKKEKESWTLLWVWTAYFPVKEIKWEFYLTVWDFNKAMNGLESELQNLSELNRKQSKAFKSAMRDYRELLRDYMKLEKENKKLKRENRFRAGIVDIVPKWKEDIADETIQDLQKRINELVWFEKEYHRLRDRIKELERVLEHEYNRKIPY